MFAIATYVIEYYIFRFYLINSFASCDDSFSYVVYIFSYLHQTPKHSYTVYTYADNKPVW